MRPVRLLVSIALLALTACGSPTTQPTHNTADVTFAQGMIPHHAQAVTMADQAVERATTARVRRLAVAIRDAQGPEIRTMSAWLRDWGEDVPATDGSMAGMGSGAGQQGHGGEDMHGSMAEMPGMMTDAQMTRLDHATGAAYDRVWLRMMVAHHEGAISAAGAEIRDGASADAIALARRIRSGQQAEVTRMKTWLSRS